MSQGYEALSRTPDSWVISCILPFCRICILVSVHVAFDLPRVVVIGDQSSKHQPATSEVNAVFTNVSDRW